MRIARWVLCATALLSACDGKAPGTGGPQRSATFEVQCEALPRGDIEVRAIPIVPVDDESLSLEALTAKFSRGRANHRTLGLTEASLGYQSSTEVSGLRDHRTGRSCFRARINIALYMQPMTVFVASEIAADDCRRAAVRSHEAKHVAVNETHLREATARLSAVLPEGLVDRVWYAADAAQAQETIGRALAVDLNAFMAAEGVRLEAEQAEVDTPAEYERVSALCPESR